MEFRVEGKVVDDFDTPNSLGLKSGNVIDVYSEQVPFNLRKFCSKAFKVFTLNEIETTKETSCDRPIVMKISSKRKRILGSKPRREEISGANLSPFKVFMVHEVRRVHMYSNWFNLKIYCVNNWWMISPLLLDLIAHSTHFSIFQGSTEWYFHTSVHWKCRIETPVTTLLFLYDEIQCKFQ